MSTVSDSTSYSNATQRLKDAYDSERTQSRTQHEEETAKLKQAYETQLKATKENYQKNLSQEKAIARDEVRKLKDDLYGNKGKKISQEAQEQLSEQKKLSNYREDITRDADLKVKKAESYSDARVEEAYQNESKKTEDALAAQKQSHFQEMKELYDELETYRNEGRDVESERAKAREESISSYEGDHIKEKSRIVDSYEKTMGRLKNQNAEKESKLSQKLNAQAIESNARARDMIRNQKDEFIEQQRSQRGEQRRMETRYQNELANAKTKNAWSERRLIEQNQEQTDRALAEKDRAYLEYLKDKNDQINSEISSKDAKIKDLETTSDTLKVSPQLVKRIHDSEEKRFNAQLNQEKEFNQLNMDATRKRDGADRADLRDQFQKQARDLSRGIRRESDVQKRGFIESYQDLKELHDQELASVKEQTQDRVGKLHLKHADELVVEQRRTQDALEEQRDSLRVEKEHAVDDLSHENKAQSREWAMKMHDLRRDYETKISQAEDEHAKQLTQIKYENDKKLRDQDRTAKRFMDEKERGFEYQIKQQELVFRERERFLTEHYEQELDKMKHTNAQLISKKS